MTISEMKDYLYDLVQSCFPEENVVWAEQYSPQVTLPLTTMKLKDTGVPRHPVNKVADGEIWSYYECTKIMEINRYTKSVSGRDGELNGLENTALEGLQEMLLYLQSNRADERAYLSNICVEQMGAVRDLSSVESGTHYKYRAMQEFKVSYTLEYKNGKATVYVPDAELKPAEGLTGYFEDVEMEEKYE